MASKLILLLTAFAALTTSSIIPPGQPDGVYIYHPDNNTHTKLHDIDRSPATPKPSSAKFKRDSILPDVAVNCAAGHLTFTDADSALRTFNDGCLNQIIRSKGDYYALSGNAVMYMCNYGGDNPCNVFEAKDAEYLIASNCGVGETGWAMISTWAKSYGIGDTTQPICSNE